MQTLCALVCMSCARVNKTYYEAISVKRPVPQAVQDAQAALHSAYLPTGGNLWCLRQRLEAYCAVRAGVWCGRCGWALEAGLREGVWRAHGREEVGRGVGGGGGTMA